MCFLNPDQASGRYDTKEKLDYEEKPRLLANKYWVEYIDCPADVNELLAEKQL